MMKLNGETRDQMASGAAPEAPPRQGRDAGYWRAVAEAEALAKAVSVRLLRMVAAAVRGDDPARDQEELEAFRLAERASLLADGICGGGS